MTRERAFIDVPPGRVLCESNYESASYWNASRRSAVGGNPVLCSHHCHAAVNGSGSGATPRALTTVCVEGDAEVQEGATRCRQRGCSLVQSLSSILGLPSVAGTYG